MNDHFGLEVFRALRRIPGAADDSTCNAFFELTQRAAGIAPAS